MTQDMESGQSTGAQDAKLDVSKTDDKQSSAIDARLEALSKQLATVQSELRGLQKTKDKRVARLQGEFAQLKSYLDRYNDPAEAERQYKLDKLLGTLDEEGDEEDDEDEIPKAKGKAKPKPEAKPDVDEELLTLVGIEPNDAELVKQMQAGKSRLEAAKEVLKARNSLPEADAAGVQSTGGGGTAETKQAALKAQYEAEIAKLKAPVQPHVLSEIDKKYRKLGLIVW